MSQPNSFSGPALQHAVATMVSYLPPRVARGIHSDSGATATPAAEQIGAAVLLADISGFTNLTEKLATVEGGAEELTSLLNGYFSSMIAILIEEGGEVVQFSGDALIAVFPAEGEPLATSVARAAQAAERMQAAMTEFATLATSVGPVELGMKIAVGAGDILSLSVGGVLNRWQYVIGGDPLRQVAEAEHVAKRGEIILSPEARAVVGPLPVAPRPLSPLDWGHADAGTVDALLTHIPGAVTYRLRAGQSDWLAELRTMTVLFLGIGGLRYSGPDDVRRIQQVMAGLQRIVYRYEGSLNKFLVDDKGVISIMLFGAPPLSHHDDPQRAVCCALDLQQFADEIGIGLSVGVTTGQTFAGPVGSDQRREYTVIGDTVNLAARLMQISGRGGVFCDHSTYWATRGEFDWETLPAQMVKGKAAAVRIYRPRARSRSGAGRLAQAQGAGQRLVGRQAELEQLIATLDEASAGRLRVALIEGDTGTGKTRLLSELGAAWVERGLVGLYSSGESIEQRTPYLAWRGIFASYFDLESLADAPASAVRERILERLGEVAPQLVERAPLLNDLLGLGFPENDLTASLDPKLRQASLNALLIDLLAAWAAERPLVLLLENGQWLDSLSWKLAQRVARSLGDAPLLLVIAYQPLGDIPDDHPCNALRATEGALHLELGPMDPADIAELAAARIGVEDLPASVAALIEQSAGGNPFIAREIVVGLLEAGVIAVEDDRCVQRQPLTRVQIPDTVQGLLLSRLDRLPPQEQLTIKIAAVIGRVFGLSTLTDIHPAHADEPQIHRAISELVDDDLIQPLASYTSLRSHAFTQSLTRDVAYNTLLHAQRRSIHTQVARWYEQQSLDDLSDLYALLVYHWNQAGNSERELHYAVEAARKFAGEYANSAALAYLDRALELCRDPAQRDELLWLRMQIYERTGEREAQRADLATLEVMAVERGDRRRLAQALNALAELESELSNYPAATAALERAIAVADGERVTRARSITIHGKVLEYQGHYHAARDRFEEALAIYREAGYRRGEATNLSHLGNVCYYIGDYAAAHRYDLESLAIRRAIGDRPGEAHSLNNLAQSALRIGAGEQAHIYQQQALDLARAIGDRAREAFILAVTGESYLVEGDYGRAQAYLEQAARLLRAVGDRRREAATLNTLGQVYRDVGAYEQALRCFQQALAIQIAIGEQSYVAYTYLNLGYAQAATDLAGAAASYAEALRLARAADNRDALAYALAYTAALDETRGDRAAARAGYEAALAIHEELGAAAAAVEHRAGLARLALADGHLPDARAHVAACLAHLAEHGADGIEFPARVYLTCADVLAAAGDPAGAAAAIEAGHSLLMGRADAISDQAAREGLLTGVADHWRLIEARLALHEHPG